VRVLLEARNAVPGRAYPLAISFGVARLDHDREMSLDDLLGAADMSLYATKRRRKQQAA
jgi:GGDEF domain-containing protein